MNKSRRTPSVDNHAHAYAASRSHEQRLHHSLGENAFFKNVSFEFDRVSGGAYGREKTSEVFIAGLKQSFFVPVRRPVHQTSLAPLA